MFGLKFILKTFNANQNHISEQCGFPKQNFTKWLNRERPIPDKWVVEIAEYFNLPSELFTKELTIEDEKFIKSERLVRLAKEFKIDITIKY